MFELLEDAPFAAVHVEIDAAEEDDAGPPVSSSNGNETSSGSRFTDEFGDPGADPVVLLDSLSSGTSVSVPATSAI